MRRADIPAPDRGETRLAEHLDAQLRRLGLDTQLVGKGERKSVLAEARAADPKAETLLVASHIDTVPVDGMEIDPFDPAIEGQRLYGRGSCDTKAGMAALLAALEGVLERGTLRRNLLVVGEADEELSSRGVYDVLEVLASRRPDWMLATEPTELRVVHRHKGIVHARVEARGVPCHSSDPAQGRSAIRLLARSILAFDEVAEALAERVDPELGPATLSVGVMGGGQAPNIVPDEAWLILDRRMLPGEDAASVRTELEGVLAKHGIEHVEVTSCKSEKAALGTDPDHASVRHCRAALQTLGHADELGVVAFGTDAGVFADHGIPGVVMGPGSIERAHTSREFVETDQVETMVDVYRELLESPGDA